MYVHVFAPKILTEISAYTCIYVHSVSQQGVSVCKYLLEIRTHTDFDNKLKLEKCSYDDWAYIQIIIKDLGIKTFEEYHGFYLNIDVNGLADVFENIRSTSIS